MANFCIPKAISAEFTKALKNGTIDPDKLRKSTSEERRKAFEPIFGPDMAKEVNALFESKLLLKDQQAGLIRWANQIRGIPEETRKNIVDQINGITRILDPADKKKFLSDLAEKKLGAEVSPEEAKELVELATKATEAKAALERASNLSNQEQLERQEAYGIARQALTEKVNQLKGQDRFDPFSLDSWKDLGEGIYSSAARNPLQAGYLRELMKSAAPLGNTALDAANTTRTVMSSIDLSAPFVQGWGMMSTKNFWEAMWPMLKYWAKEENFQQLNARIIGHPYYDLALDGKLGITSVEQPGSIGAREDYFQSHLIEQIVDKVSGMTKEKLGVGVPNLFRASDRAFTGFINNVRFYRFVDLVNAARMAGEDVSLGSQTVKELAKVVNDFTGRGSLGKYGERAAPILNSIFFSARKQAATLNMLSGVNFISASPTARKAALRQLLGSLLATGTVIYLAKLSGGDVNLDPISQNFAQVRLPGSDTYKDYTGTNATWVRLFARLYSNSKINSSGKEVPFGTGFGMNTRADEIISFVRNKLGTNSAILANYLWGSDPVGRPFISVLDELQHQLMPMTMGSYIDLANSPHETTFSELTSIDALFGVGMRPVHYSPAVSGVNIWGNQDSLVHDKETETLDGAAEEASYQPYLPPKYINGIKLSHEQYMEYVIQSGLVSKQLLLPKIQSDSWGKLTPEQKNQTFKDYIGIARQSASTYMQAKYPEILMESIKKSIQGNK